jgi:hypothetical protein
MSFGHGRARASRLLGSGDDAREHSANICVEHRVALPERERRDGGRGVGPDSWECQQILM